MANVSPSLILIIGGVKSFAQYKNERTDGLLFDSEKKEVVQTLSAEGFKSFPSNSHCITEYNRIFAYNGRSQLVEISMTDYSITSILALR